MTIAIASIGFGEAARGFADSWRRHGAAVRSYDLKLKAGAQTAMRDAMTAQGISPCDTPEAALAGAEVAFSLVTADQALAAAQTAAAAMPRDLLWLDMNSVAPDTKRAAAAAIGAAGGRYCDVAIMAPVHPAGATVPLLISGPHADAGADVLAALGFGNVRNLRGATGDASAIKMIRSIMVKGLEALTAECMLAAEAAGLRGDVLASLDTTAPAAAFAERADYSLDRMLIHGRRRAAELAEVAKTIDALGTGSAMTRAAIGWQEHIGALGAGAPAGLAAKLDLLLGRRADEAA